MKLDEFRDTGYLQEANRRFFHPLGLALGVVMNSVTGPQYLIVQDHRDDPEGMIFGEGEDAPEAGKYERVEREWRKRAAVRQEALGYVVQPVEAVGEEA